MADVIGHLEETGDRVRVRSANGELHEFRGVDVMYVRRLTDRVVKNSEIRAVEHAAALAWPGVQHGWFDGWWVRAGAGSTLRANSAVPLDMFAHASSIAAIIDWYGKQGLPPRLAVPERLLKVPEDIPTECESRTLVGDLAADGVEATDVSAVILATQPDERWLAGYARAVPAEVLTAVAGGQVMFASIPGAAVARGAVTESPDGTRWLGVSEVRVAAEQRGRGHARAVCAALRSWGREHGATRGYAQVRDGDTAGLLFFQSLGFNPQHRTRYLDARLLQP